MFSTLEPNFPTLKSHPFGAFSVLVVDDEQGLQTVLSKALSQWFAKVETVSSVEEAENLRCQYHYDLILLDVNLPGRSGIEWHEVFAADEKQSDVILMTGYADLETAISAIKLGVTDFILKPFSLNQMLKAVERCMTARLEQRKQFALEQQVERHYAKDIIGNSSATLAVKQLIAQFAPSKSAVLIQGESGTGKELVARGIHQASGRSGAFVPINCAAIAPELLESELFGHVSGAFTGAKNSKEGLFRVASGGTLFLDEIGEMPLTMQSSLLRVLEQKMVRPVGGEKEVSVDLRIVAATNRQLAKEVESGRFREDLFYRLNVLIIEIAPLRERKQDLVELVPFFTHKLAKDLGVKAPKWAHNDMQALNNYDWPGNIRELKNLLERCLLLGTPVAEHLSDNVLTSGGDLTQVEPCDDQPPCGYPNSWPLKRVEKAHIQQVVDLYDGNKSAAARDLGVARKTLERKYRDWQSEAEFDDN